MAKERFTYFYAILFSLFIHLVLLSFCILDWIPHRKIPSFKRPTASVLQLVELPSTPKFISTEEMPAIKKPVKKTQFISDRNTRLRSIEKGKGDDLLPTQQGREIPGIQLRDQSEQKPSKASVSSLEEKVEAKTEKTSLISKESSLLSNLTRQQERRAPKKAFLAETKPIAESAPFSFRQEKTFIQGAEAPLGEAGVNAEATPLGRYKAKVFQLIGSQWRFMVRRQNSLLSYGSVKIRFWLQGDGVLERLEVLSQTQGSEFLQTLSENSVRLCAPYENFSEEIKQQVGDHLMLEATFTIY